MENSYSLNSALWVDQYGDTLYGYTLMRVKNPDSAQEIVQVTLLAALQSQKSFTGRFPEKSWLFGILKHKILDHFRILKTRRTFEVSPDDDADADPYEKAFDENGHFINPPKKWQTDPLHAAENEELVLALAKCMEGLPEKFRHIFILKEVEGMKSGDICKEMEIQPNNLWVILHRARNQLKKCLEANDWHKKQ